METCFKIDLHDYSRVERSDCCCTSLFLNQKLIVDHMTCRRGYLGRWTLLSTLLRTKWESVWTMQLSYFILFFIISDAIFFISNYVWLLCRSLGSECCEENTVFLSTCPQTVKTCWRSFSFSTPSNGAVWRYLEQDTLFICETKKAVSKITWIYGILTVSFFC